MTDYRRIKEVTEFRISGIPYKISNLSNVIGVLNEYMEDINWVGFYIMKDGKLILGPFQGKAAVALIEVGNGVCGTAVRDREVKLVKNVHEYPGHIVCDTCSNSEIVVPIYNKDNSIWGVLDIDSPVLNRFDENDQAGLLEIAKIIEEQIL